MTSAFALDDDIDAHDSILVDDDDDDDDALQVALAFVDEFQAPFPSSSSDASNSGLAVSPPSRLLQPSHQSSSLNAMSQQESEQRLQYSNGSAVPRIPQYEKSHQHLQTGIFNAHSINNNNNSSSKMKQQLAKKRVSNALKRATPCNASNKARDGRKEELIYLRKKVSELELQLAERKKTKVEQELQTGIVSAQPSSRPPPPPPVTTVYQPRSKESSSATPSVWEEIATRQYNQRVKAERENIRLKVVLENQLKIARSLEKVLQKTTCTKDFEKLIHGKPLPYSVRSSPTSQGSENADGRLFQELLAGLDQSYAEAEGIFQASGLVRAESSYIDAVVRSDDSHGIQLEVVASKVLPFDMRTAGSVVWHHYAFAKERLPNRAYHHNSPQTLNVTEDTIIEDFNLEIDINSAIALFHVKLVMRRYSEEDRIVLVWRAFFDPLCIADEPTPGVRFLERGYIVIKSSGGVDSSAAMASSCSSSNVLQTCYIATPVATGDLADADPAKVGAITDFVLSATAANISSSHEMIENVLLEHAIKSNFGI